EQPTAAEPDAGLAVAEVPQQPEEKRVPFYKREITLRRRKPEPVAVTDETGAMDEPLDEPLDEPAGADDGEATGATPAIPIGFAAPPEADDAADEPVEDAEPVEDDEPMQVEPVAEVTEDEDRSAQDAELPGDAVEEEPTSGVEADVDDVRASAPPEATDPTDVELPEPEVPPASPVPGFSQAATPEPELLDDANPVDPDASSVADEEDIPAEADVVASAPPSGKRTSIRARRGGRGGTPRPKSNGARGGSRGGGRKVVGLKIGASQIAAAVVVPGDGRHELVALARRPLEPGIVVDGEVRDGQALREALKEFFAEHKLPRKDVRVGVASNRIGVRTVDLSGIEDEARFDNAVRFKAHEVLPVSVSESVLDYRVVEERVTENGDTVRRVLLVVAPRDQVEPFAAACTDSGLKLAGIDLEALALLRAFVEPQPAGLRAATDTATVAVAIGHESTTLLVSGGGACEFTRVFDWGGLALQQAIALELDVHTADAAAILRGLSLAGEGHTGLDEETRVRALDAVRMRLTPFARELVSSLQFYQAQDGSLGIGEIVITGGTSHLHGLAEALHQMIGVSVRVGDPLQRVHVTAPLDEELRRTIGSLAVPVGLAIVDDPARSVNLLPDELRRQRRTRPSPLKVALPVAAVVPIAAMGFLFLQASGDVSDQRSSLDAVQAQIDALPEPTRPVIDASLAVEQQQRAAALASVLGTRLAWDRVLGDLSRVLPRNVWLTSFSAKTPDPVTTGTAALPAAAPGVAPTPTGVTISGYTYSLPDVALLLARLGTVPSLTNVVLGSSAKSTIGKRTAISFTIAADIDGNGGAQ
ncbi:MAG: type IV pilus assembly protein PilM, partial [Gaiella sp.]